jgi:chromosome segregation ATPase
VTLKESLDAANTRITEVEGELASSKETISKFEAAKADFESKLEVANGDVITLKAEKIELTGKVSALQVEKTELTGKVTKLEAEAKDADERSREIAARAGANLPAKAQGVGNQTTSGSAKTMSRADFEALTSANQRAFCKDGGKLTD